MDGDGKMFYIIVGIITFIAFILLIITIYYNKFQFAIIKIEEAENRRGYSSGRKEKHVSQSDFRY